MIFEVKDKIVNLRKELRISQKELAGDGYSQSYVAAIEKGKRSISEEALHYFTARFNEEYRKKGIEKEIRYEWLSKSFEKQLEELYEELCNDILECEEKKKLEKHYESIKKIEEHLSIEQRVKILHYLGYKFLMVEEYEKSEEIYRKALYDAIVLEDYDYLGKILFNLSCSLEAIKKVERLREFEELLEKYEENIEYTILDGIYVNIIILYEFKEDSKNAIKYIEKVEKICKKERKSHFIVNKFTHYLVLGDIKSAKRIYSDYEKGIESFYLSAKYFYKLDSLKFFEMQKEFKEIDKIINESLNLESQGKFEMDTKYRLAKALIKYRDKEQGKLLLKRILMENKELTPYNYVHQVEGIKRLMPLLEREEVYFVKNLWEKTKELLKGYKSYSYIPPFISYYNNFYYTKELNELNNDLEEIFSVKN